MAQGRILIACPVFRDYVPPNGSGTPLRMLVTDFGAYYG